MVSVIYLQALKAAGTNLDTDKFDGRTAVQQCWDYLNGLPDTSWGIVSNFSEIRLYHKSTGNQAYEVFTLQQLRDIDEFRKFWCLLDRGGLLAPAMGQLPRATELLRVSGERRTQVGDDLYNYYSDQRARLIEHLRKNHGKTLDAAIHIAQKLFDRIIFVAFCQDRGFLNKNAIRRSYEAVPPFYKVTNPRWQNFLSLFHVVDKGGVVELAHGYNGGLFTHDAEVDDLQLEDDWTNIFVQIGNYDFKDEVNVDVLGHIFERSINELEKMRVAGVFSPETMPGPAPAMQKSAQRKRFGVYYTPPEFTQFLVRSTVGDLIDLRFNNLKKAHEITLVDEESGKPQPRMTAYYQQCLQTLRNMKIVDPACGSGAFLIAAYDLLEDYYTDVCRNLSALNVPGHAELTARIPDMILNDNLYGVDLSEQAVEITRLALWIKTVRYDKTLADLSRNIVCGNSLVEDAAVHRMAMKWQEQFPEVFGDASRPFGAGFDAVIGNPPWERLKLQEREFFAFSAPEIAGAVSAAARRKLIEPLEKDSPELYGRYKVAQQSAERMLDYARQCGRYPLTGQGDINTYMLFAELARSLVAPHGRAGLLVPSGIATDDTTKEFFSALIEGESLIQLYDFENKEGFFPDVHRAFKFSTLVFGGSAVKNPVADFAFYIHRMEQLRDRDRHITLSKKDIALLNPNTHTSPVFRTRRDCQITTAIYRRVPILVDESRKEGGNPWGIRFVRMFDQTNDAELFTEGGAFKKDGFKLEGNIWKKGKQTYLPLYEAKMIQAYDHRAARP
ncbi:MAG: Eco57I restriction-modification methylase domain-containing protein [Phycisphaerae bacterium]